MMSAWTWGATWVTASASKGLTRPDAAALVWVAALLAMVTKGSLAVTLGVGVRLWIAEHVSPRYVRYVVVGAMIVLGVCPCSKCSAF